MKNIPLLAALVAALTANAQIAVPTDIRAKVPAPQPAEWWSRSFEERQKKIESSGGSSVVFVGDSITHGWDDGSVAECETRLYRFIGEDSAW